MFLYLQVTRGGDLKPGLPHPVWYSEPATIQVNFNKLSENELTIVTGYFEIGAFQKGFGGNIRTSKAYKKWLTVFARIKNPVVAYFDNAANADLMRVLRQNHPKTRISVIDRRTLWCFREMHPRIVKIFAQKKYPRHPPNTVKSNYTASVNSKYELMRWTIRDNPFRTAYIAWLDIGLFRSLAKGDVSSAVNNSELFRLGIPPDLNSSAVGYTLMYPRQSSPTLTAEAVVRGNIDWVSGAFFIGRIDVMWRWTTEFLSAVKRMVSEKWISADQQTITWLMMGEGQKKIQPKTNLQLYKPAGLSDPWFYLGYLAKKIGKQNTVSPRPSADMITSWPLKKVQPKPVG